MRFISTKYNNVALIGGGGKTSLMELLAKQYRSVGQPVLLTTTTRLGRGQLDHLELVEAATLNQALKAARRVKEGESLVLTRANDNNPAKLSGIPAQWFLPLRQSLGDEAVFLVEADGSRSLPVKAHESNEPVLPPIEPLSVVALLGLKALLQPWETVVHRPEIFIKILGEKPDAGQCLSPQQLAMFIIKAWSVFKPELIVLNQADLLERENKLDEAQMLVSLLNRGGFSCTVLSLLNNKKYDI